MRFIKTLIEMYGWQYAVIVSAVMVLGTANCIFWIYVIYKMSEL